MIVPFVIPEFKFDAAPSNEDKFVLAVGLARRAQHDKRSDKTRVEQAQPLTIQRHSLL